jgi:hypothetical protein
MKNVLIDASHGMQQGCGLTINAGSGRFGDRAEITPQQWDAAVKLGEPSI